MNPRIIRWFLVLLIVVFTIVFSLSTFSPGNERYSASAQPRSTPVDGPRDPFTDLTRYPVVDFDAPLPENTAEQQKRQSISQRYDKQDLVFRNPHPNDGAVKVFEETDPVDAIPVDKCDMIVLGRVNELAAHLTNDKTGVYSEFSVEAERVLKNSGPAKVSIGELITADRAGGYVKYSNGQKVLYVIDGKGLPELGKEYVFFLASDKSSPNFKVITVYELPADEIVPLDRVKDFSQYKSLKKSGFVEAVSKKVASLGKP